MRLFFYPLGGRLGTVLGAAATPAQIQEEMWATSRNTGNMVHLEAIPKMLHYRRAESAILQSRLLTPTEKRIENEALYLADESVQRTIDETFDGIVLGYANMIRSSTGEQSHINLDAQAEWLSRTRCRIFVFGVGLQDRLPESPAAVDPRILRLLKIFNERAELFGVRGSETETWLHGIGLTRAVALGCPSMFAYPTNTFNIGRLERASDLHLGTAGRLQKKCSRREVGCNHQNWQDFHCQLCLSK